MVEVEENICELSVISSATDNSMSSDETEFFNLTGQVAECEDIGSDDSVVSSTAYYNKAKRGKLDPLLPLLSNGTCYVCNKKISNSIICECEEERLITLVFQRPPLWNYKIPLNQRDKMIKQKLWEEIWHAFNGRYTSARLRYTWKTLSTSYKKLRTMEKERKDFTEWKHFHIMKFLDSDKERQYSYSNNNNSYDRMNIFSREKSMNDLKIDKCSLEVMNSTRSSPLLSPCDQARSNKNSDEVINMNTNRELPTKATYTELTSCLNGIESTLQKTLLILTGIERNHTETKTSSEHFLKLLGSLMDQMPNEISLTFQKKIISEAYELILQDD